MVLPVVVHVRFRGFVVFLMRETALPRFSFVVCISIRFAGFIVGQRVVLIVPRVGFSVVVFALRYRVSHPVVLSLLRCLGFGFAAFGLLRRVCFGCGLGALGFDLGNATANHYLLFTQPLKFNFKRLARGLGNRLASASETPSGLCRKDSIS